MTVERINSYAPATGEHILSWESTSIDEVEKMFQISKKASVNWGQLSILERLSYFRALRDILIAELEEATTVISKSTGKVKLDALASDIMPVLDFLSYLDKKAVSILKQQKMKTPLIFIGKKSYVEYMPRGTVAIISPWNYPFQLTMIPILSALIGGNTVISKPSEVTPAVGKYMEKLFAAANFPEGVIQIAHGAKEVGQALIDNQPDYIFFTGSVATGKVIAEQAAKHLIPVTLELGGKDPMIVCHDANLERAAKGAVWGGFTNSGQVCMSVERLYVDERVYDVFVQLVKREVEKLMQGTNINDDIGSMTFKKQIEIVKEHVTDALTNGAKLVTGNPPEKWQEGSHFLQPIVLTDVKDNMKIIQEETFGPVLPIMSFRDEEDAIIKANSSPYGLNASIWSNDLKKARKMASRLESGAVLINDVLISVANHHLPFGGAKKSGIGNYHGENGLRMFCQEKAIMVDLGKRASEVQWYPYKGKYENFSVMIESYFGSKKNWLGFLSSYLKLLKSK